MQANIPEGSEPAARQPLSFSFGTQMRQVKSFARTYGRFAYITLWDQKPRLALTAVFAIVGAMMQTGVLGVIAGFIALIQQDGPVEFQGLEIALPSPAVLVSVMAGSVLSLLAASSFLSFLAATQSRRLGRIGYQICVHAAADALVRGRDYDLVGTGYSRLDAQAQVTRNCLMAGMATEMLAMSLQPIFYVVLTLSVLLLVDFTMTLALAPLSLVLVPLVFIRSKGIHKHSEAFYGRLAQAWGAEVGGFVKQVESIQTTPPHPSLLPGTLLSKQSFDDFMEGYDNNKLGDDRMSLTVGLVRAFLLAAGVLIFGILATSGRASLGGLIIYAGALYLLLNNTQSLSLYLANLNRYYPQIRNLLRFLDQVGAYVETVGRRAETHQAAPAYVSVSIEPELPNSAATVDIQKGKPYLQVTSHRPGRFTIGAFTEALRAFSDSAPELWLDASFVTRFYDLGEGPLSDNVLIAHSSETLEAANHLLDALIDDEDRSLLGEGLQSYLGPHDWQRLSERTKSALRLLHLMRSESPVVIIDVKLLRDLREEESIHLVLNEFRDQFCIIAGDQGAIPNCRLEAVVVENDGKLIGAGDLAWYMDNRQAISKIHQNSISARQSMDVDLIG